MVGGGGYGDGGGLPAWAGEMKSDLIYLTNEEFIEKYGGDKQQAEEFLLSALEDYGTGGGGGGGGLPDWAGEMENDLIYGSTPGASSDSDFYTPPATGTGGSSDAWGGGTKYPSTGPTGTMSVTGTLTDSKTSVNLPVAPLSGGISTIGGSLASLIGGIKNPGQLAQSVKVPGSNVALAGSDVVSKLGGKLTADGKITIPLNSPSRGALDTLTGPGVTEAATAARNILPLLGLALLLFRR